MDLGRYNKLRHAIILTLFFFCLFSCVYSDATGLGYILLSNDNPMLYAPSKFLGNQRSSYGLYFTITVSLSTTSGLKDTTSVM